MVNTNAGTTSVSYEVTILSLFHLLSFNVIVKNLLKQGMPKHGKSVVRSIHTKLQVKFGTHGGNISDM